MDEVEIFTPAGVVAGAALRDGFVHSKDLRSPVAIERARWYPLDGSPPERRGSVLVPPDDVLLVALVEIEPVVHAAWYSLAADLGPYRVEGRMPIPPGFDPDRALARPTGAFVPLWDAHIELMHRPDAGIADRSVVHLNRYAVERVESSLMLGFFFPGAHFVGPSPASVA